MHDPATAGLNVKWALSATRTEAPPVSAMLAYGERPHLLFGLVRRVALSAHPANPPCRPRGGRSHA